MKNTAALLIVLLIALQFTSEIVSQTGMGACCLSSSASCSYTTPSDCTSLFGLFNGVGSDCTNTVCCGPQLGDARTFALFAYKYVFYDATSSNPPLVEGDIGTVTGTISGFGSISGSFHQGDQVAVSANQGFDNALTASSNYPCMHTLPSTVSTRTFTPGVYCGAVQTFNGDFTFDAQGDNKAIFIFRMQTSTFNQGTMAFINGAQRKNVFWFIVGQCYLYNQMHGTIMATEWVQMYPSSTLHGRLYTRHSGIGKSLTTSSASMVAITEESSCSTPLVAVEPVVNCVQNYGNGVCATHWGYRNHNNVSVSIPVGSFNQFTPAPNYQSLNVTTFNPGENSYVIATVHLCNVTMLTWSVTVA